MDTIIYCKIIARRTRTNIKKSDNRVMNLDTKHNNQSCPDIAIFIKESWQKITPFWPLKNLVGVNPLHGFQDMDFEQAILQGAVFFQQKEFPQPMEQVNRQTIKWLQAFFDEGQATLAMPIKSHGFYQALKKLMYFDDQIHNFDPDNQQWLSNLPETSESAIEACFARLNISKEYQLLFMTLMLTTLPGWASYVKYYADWSEQKTLDSCATLKTDYLAVRMIITTLLWQDSIELIAWHNRAKEFELKKNSPLKQLQKAEKEYLLPLLHALKSEPIDLPENVDAQFVFCIDVRSEGLRKALQRFGKYESFGCAGFFGLPIFIKNSTTEELYASCPVLLRPKHTVNQVSCSLYHHKGHKRLRTLRALYQSLKYNFVTSFALVELLGFATGFWMALKTFTPPIAHTLSRFAYTVLRSESSTKPCLQDISFQDQCMYAKSVLQAIGLTKNFAPIIIFCGHASTTQNNPYATFLNCGACAGRYGGSNAKTIVTILNLKEVRNYLSQIGIVIPSSTCFIAAQHNTTTDHVEMYEDDIFDDSVMQRITNIKNDLKQAQKINCQQRCKKMGINLDAHNSIQQTQLMSLDWAQVRPEWGLAKNASFIIAPSKITEKIDFDGRAFLHSYDYTQDFDGAILTIILTGPMVVGQWINAQYFFSTLDNVAYGSGSKITTNITGKIGIMQGNASDLMHGLPLQSVYTADNQPYHEPLRLMTIVYAPWNFIDKIIQNQPDLQTLFRNSWVLLVSIDPETNDQYFLHKDLVWRKDFFYE